jgi:hypothetical protein
MENKVELITSPDVPELDYYILFLAWPVVSMIVLCISMVVIC